LLPQSDRWPSTTDLARLDGNVWLGCSSLIGGRDVALHFSDLESENRSFKRHVSGLTRADSPAQEINLVELIWDSVAAVPQAIEVSPEVKADLAAWLVEFERDPEAGYAWDQLKEKLKKRIVAYRLKFSSRTVREVGEAHDRCWSSLADAVGAAQDSATGNYCIVSVVDPVADQDRASHFPTDVGPDWFAERHRTIRATIRAD